MNEYSNAFDAIRRLHGGGALCVQHLTGTPEKTIEDSRSIANKLAAEGAGTGDLSCPENICSGQYRPLHDWTR